MDNKFMGNSKYRIKSGGEKLNNICQNCGKTSKTIFQKCCGEAMTPLGRGTEIPRK
jgi:hypothetical protein